MRYRPEASAPTAPCEQTLEINAGLGAPLETSIEGADPAASGTVLEPLPGRENHNVAVPRSLAGRGEVDILLTVDARAANPVKVNIR